MKKIATLLFLMTIASAHAEFENTKWGMDLFDLRMMYQSGHSKKSKDNVVEYITLTSFKNYPDSAINFILTKDKLNSVIVDLGNKYSSDRCEEILNNLVKQYTTEYGQPDFQDDNVYAWNVKDRGSVMLTSITKKSGCAPWISYFNRPFFKDGKFCDPLKNSSSCE